MSELAQILRHICTPIKYANKAADRLDAQDARIAELEADRDPLGIRVAELERANKRIAELEAGIAELLREVRGPMYETTRKQADRIAELEEALKPFAELGLNDDKTIIRGIVDALLSEGRTPGSEGMASIQWLMEKCLAARKARDDS